MILRFKYVQRNQIRSAKNCRGDGFKGTGSVPFCVPSPHGAEVARVDGGNGVDLLVKASEPFCGTYRSRPRRDKGCKIGKALRASLAVKEIFGNIVRTEVGNLPVCQRLNQFCGCAAQCFAAVARKHNLVARDRHAVVLIVGKPLCRFRRFGTIGQTDQNLRAGVSLLVRLHLDGRTGQREQIVAQNASEAALIRLVGAWENNAVCFRQSERRATHFAEIPMQIKFFGQAQRSAFPENIIRKQTVDRAACGGIALSANGKPCSRPRDPPVAFILQRCGKRFALASVGLSDQNFARTVRSFHGVVGAAAK